MAFGQFGGDGSVEWEVDVDHGTCVHQPKVPRGHRAGGVDPSKGPPQSPGDQFTVTLRAPKGKSGKDLLKLITADKNRVKVKIPIERNTPRQVRVDW